MHCPECGANLPDHALYCGMCGKRLDEEDPALFVRSSMIGGPPTGLTGPLPSLTEEELAALLRGGRETSASGEGAEQPEELSEGEGSPDFGESAEVGRGEEFGRKAVSFEGIYQEDEAEETPAELPEAPPSAEKAFAKEGRADEPAPGGGPAPAGQESGGAANASAGNGSTSSGGGGWKRTLLISVLAIAATAALVLWTVRTLSGTGGNGPGLPAITPTMAEGPAFGDSKTESVSSGDSSAESTASADSSAESTASADSSAESTASADSSAESTASADSKAESRGTESPGNKSDRSGTSKTDSSDESHGGRRRVTATPTPTLLPTLSPTPRPTKTPTPAPKTDVDFIRQALGDKNAVLLYVSDAGSAWHTELTLRNDATFTGSYEEAIVEIAGDHEMIVRNCTFTGHVYDCKKLKNGTYSMKIKVRMNGSEGESHLDGKKRYVTAWPRGLNSDDGIILYPPGTSTEGLNEGLLGWLRRARGSDITSAQLPCYCVLDLNTGYGFGEYGK